MLTVVLVTLILTAESAHVKNIFKKSYNNFFQYIACKTLDDYCLTCNSSLSCTSCSSSKYGLGPSCVNTCPSDTYINSGVCTSCKTLNSECTTCNSSITCTGCLNSKYALAATCVASCPSDTYINSGICTCKRDFEGSEHDLL